jgi:sulfatase modifying factor 1
VRPSARTAFVEATGHVTTADVPPDPADCPGTLPEMLCAASLVFTQPPGPVDLRDITNWWTFLPGADWLSRHPTGPDSISDGFADQPIACRLVPRERLRPGWT